MTKTHLGNTEKPYRGPINETERRLVLYTPPAKRKGTPIRHRILSFACAFFCVFSAAIGGINTATYVQRTSMEGIVLRLGNFALFGLGTITVQKEKPLQNFPSTDVPDESNTLPPPPESANGESAEDAQTVRYPIQAADIGGKDLHALLNETTYEPDTEALLSSALPFPDLSEHMEKYGPDAPYILILHTHGTESFSPEGADTYTTSDSFRSNDVSKNIVAVGAVMAETFERAGIPTLHVTEMFDEQSYQDSYSRAAAAIREYIKEYPSIQIVLDVHRDSIIRADMTKIRPVTTVDGKDTAQFMTVVGTDFKGANHPDWTKNLSFALKIQENLMERADRFARTVNLRGAGFNQQYTNGSLLLEVGSCGNTLTEAKRAGALAAIAIADVVSGGKCTLTVSDILP